MLEKKLHQKVDWLAVVLIAIVSFTAVVCGNAVNTRYLFGTDPNGILFSIFRIFLLFTMFSGVCLLLGKVYTFLADEGKIAFRLTSPNMYKWLFLSFVSMNLLFLCAYYPGLGTWDTDAQLTDFFNGVTSFVYVEANDTVITARLNDHHPVGTTLLFSSFVALGNALDNERLGYACYVVLQILLYCYAFTSVIRFLGNTSARMRMLTALFYLFNPFLCYYAINMLKDSLYSALLLLYFVEYMALYLHRCPKKEKGTALRLFAYSIMLSLSKKTGVYLVVLSNLFLLAHSIVKKKTFRSIAFFTSSALLPALLMFVLLPQWIFPVFQIFPGGKQEMLATFFQQTARLKIEHPDAYTEEDIQIINAVFDYENIEKNYNQNKTDPIKNTYRLESVSNEDLKQYLTLWLRKGLRYPFVYIKATLGTCGGFFSPTTKLYVYTNNHYVVFSHRSLSICLRNLLQSVYSWLLNTPGVNLFFSNCLFTWWIPLLGTYRMIRKKRVSSLGAFIPMYISILILVVCPYSFARYALPLVMIAPLVLFTADVPDETHPSAS